MDAEGTYEARAYRQPVLNALARVGHEHMRGRGPAACVNVSMAQEAAQRLDAEKPFG